VPAWHAIAFSALSSGQAFSGAQFHDSFLRGQTFFVEGALHRRFFAARFFAFFFAISHCLFLPLDSGIALRVFLFFLSFARVEVADAPLSLPAPGREPMMRVGLRNPWPR